MRCNNCGYDNDSGVSTCIKCGHRLQAGGGYVPDSYQGVYAPNYGGAGEPLSKATVVGAFGGNEPLPKATVIGSAGMREQEPRPTRVANPVQKDQQGTVDPVTTRQCPNCGYPVMNDFTHCPSCGTAMNANQQPEIYDDELLLAKDIVLNCDHCGKEIPANYAFCPYCGEKIQAKTVFRRRHQIEPSKPKCKLTIIPDDDEQIEARVNRFEGDAVVLTRENTEPANRSITTKKQAELLCEDGKWFIANHSELCSTALEVNRKMELQSGDIIILGDRRFLFEEEA